MAAGAALKVAYAIAASKDNKKGKSVVSRIIAVIAAFFLVFIVVIVSVFEMATQMIAGIFIGVFGPLIESEKYQTEAIYASIGNYGGAYKVYNLEELANKGIDPEIIEYLFQQEYYSYDSLSSKISVPYISENSYNEWLKGSPKLGDGSDAAYTSSIDVLWDMNASTYQYRTHWQYLVAVSSVKNFTNSKSVNELIKNVVDNIDANGNLKEGANPKLNITKDDLAALEESMRQHNMWTDIHYFTNYTSDYLAGFDSADSGWYYCGDFSQQRIVSGFSFTNYCHSYYLPNASNKRVEQYDENGICRSMRFSSLSSFYGKYFVGSKPGEYAYITSNGYMYPVMLVSRASNWLSIYSDYDYVKIRESSGDTHYVLSTYKKTYRIGDMLKQWKSYGLDESMYDYVLSVLGNLQDSLGGSLATELRTAYDYYKKYGKELEVIYTNPTYAPNLDKGNENIGNQYATELSTLKTNSSKLTSELKALYRADNPAKNSDAGDAFKPDISVGLSVAQALYSNNVCYQPASSTHVNAGYQCRVYDDVSYAPPKGWGNLAYDKSDLGTEDSDMNARVGLCSAGFVNYILRYSLFGSDYRTGISATPTISQLYEASDYKFRTVSELRVGDIAFLSPDENDDSKNVVGYYIGPEGGNHIFYTMNPAGAFNSSGVVRKVCLSTDPGDVDIMKCNLTYFCRYYTGSGGEVVEEYTRDSGAAVFNGYCAVKRAYEYFVNKNPACSGVGYSSQFVYAVLANPIEYGCTNYANKEWLLHMAVGIMSGGKGNDEEVSLDELDKNTAAYESGFFIFPIEENQYTEIIQWYSWVDANGNGHGTDADGFETWHDGIDIAAPAGTPVLAAADGIILSILSDYDESLNDDYEEAEQSGNYVVIDHGEHIFTKYAHLSSIVGGITTGTKVSKGQIIGYVGTSGGVLQNQVHFKVSDGKYHANYEGMPFLDRGKRESVSMSVDPYMFFPSLAGSKKVREGIYYDRPRWFEADKRSNLVK